MSTIRRVDDILTAAGLRTTRDEQDGRFLGTDTDCATSGPSRHFPRAVTIAPHAKGEWFDANSPTVRAIADEATKALVMAGLAPFSRAGWRTVICVVAEPEPT